MLLQLRNYLKIREIYSQKSLAIDQILYLESLFLPISIQNYAHTVDFIHEKKRHSIENMETTVGDFIFNCELNLKSILSHEIARG